MPFKASGQPPDTYKSEAMMKDYSRGGRRHRKKWKEVGAQTNRTRGTLVGTVSKLSPERTIESKKISKLTCARGQRKNIDSSTVNKDLGGAWRIGEVGSNGAQ